MMEFGLPDLSETREGPRPQTAGPAPHRQVSQFPASNEYAIALHEFAMRLDGVTNGASRIGDGGLSAFFLEDFDVSGWSEHFLIDNEFAHIHAHPSHSLHLVLPRLLGLRLERQGWTEQHPLAVAGSIPPTNFLLFGARDDMELHVSQWILRQSWAYARESSLAAAPATLSTRQRLRCSDC